VSSVDPDGLGTCDSNGGCSGGGTGPSGAGGVSIGFSGGGPPGKPQLATMSPQDFWNSLPHPLSSTAEVPFPADLGENERVSTNLHVNSGTGTTLRPHHAVYAREGRCAQ